MKSTNIRMAVCLFALRAACAAQEPQAPGKVLADYNQARSHAVEQVNQKYIPLADAEVKLSLKDGDLKMANAINDWSKRLAGTDDKENTFGIVPGTAPVNRLALLQADYLKERTAAVMLVDKSYLGNVEAAKQQAMKDGNLDAANAADNLLGRIKTELGDAAPPGNASAHPFGVQAGVDPGNSAAPAAPAATPGPTAPPVAAGRPGTSGFMPGVGFGTSTMTSRFAGTVWVSTSFIGGSHGAIATLKFQPDGTWIEIYTPHPMRGHWKVTKDASVVEVDITNDSINGRNPIHFKISDDGATCKRVEDSVAYAIKK